MDSRNFTHWKEQNHVFEGMAGFRVIEFSLTGAGETERLRGMLITPEFFSLLGVRPMLGRGFLPEENEPGTTNVAIPGHGVWQRRFASDPALLGKAITLDGKITDPPVKAPFW